MKIETKLNVNDECYVMHNNKIFKSKIIDINIDVNINEKVQITYWVGDVGRLPERLVFTTKEEILKFLEKTIKER